MHNEMEKVHMKPNEIHILNQFLGGGRKTEDGAWDLRGLEHLFNQPYVKQIMDDHMYEHEMRKMAHGGRVEHERSEGRHGDSEIAYLPTSVSHYFDRIIGGESRNPHTGHKEYFLPALLGGLARLAPLAMRGISSLGSSLGSLFGSASSAAAPVARAAASTLGRGVTQLGQGAASVGRAAGNIGSRIASNPYVQSAGRGAMTVGRGLNKGFEFAGNVANAALPISMLYDRFGGGQSSQQEDNSQQSNNYQPAESDSYNDDYSGYANAGSRGGAMNYNNQYNAQPNYGYQQNYGGNGYNSQQYMPQSYNQQPQYLSQKPRPPRYGQEYQQVRTAGYLPSQADIGAPQYQGGYAEALNRYGPGGGQYGSPRRPQPMQQSYNPYGNYSYR